MSDHKSSTLSLLEDLEAIQKSLNKIANTSAEIPTLDEIVEDTPPKSLNPDNPFLSSASLSELIRIRNEAEARAAQELASLGRVKSIDEILKPQKAPGPESAGPDPEAIIEQMETLFHTWLEHSVKQYLQVFEGELRNHLRQDFRQLVTQWYHEHGLPIPDHFQTRKPASTEDDIADPQDE